MNNGCRNKIIIIALIFITSMNITFASDDDFFDDEKIILESATEYDYPPYSVTDGGKADGFSVELLKAVVREIGMDVEFKVDDWHTIKDQLEKGQLDVLPLVGYNEEREEYFDFTVPYIIMRGNIFIRKEDEGQIQSEADLKDKKIIVMEGDNAQEYAVEKGWADNLILTDTYTEAFELLNSGKYHAVIAQSLVGEKIISDLGLKKIIPVYVYDAHTNKRIKLQLEDFEQKFCFAVEEGNSVLLARLNEGLALVSANGTYDAIYNKWFPFLVEGPDFMDVVMWVSIILVPVLILLLIISAIIIRKQVRDKTAFLAKQAEEIEYVSYHDSLTGLYNRRYFEKALLKLDYKKYFPLTLLVADLNGLKIVNDAFGHLAGDHMIKTAANVLKDACRDSDIVSRWGGDEFVCILPNANESDVQGVIDRIDHSLSNGLTDYGRLSLSFGYETKYEDRQSIIELFKIAEEYMYKNKMTESEGARGQMIGAMMTTLFEKSPIDKEHSERVSLKASELARALKLKPAVIADVKTIGLLHDIGKIVVNQSLLDKSGPLLSDEWDQIQQHPLIGYRVLSTSKEFSHIAKGVLYHHERLDGTGYPEGISGENIPIESKIISVVDAYDAMTSYRPYKKRMLSDIEAAKELKKNMDTQFDGQIVECFVKNVLDLNWDKL